MSNGTDWLAGVDETKVCPDCGRQTQFGEECGPCLRFADGAFSEDSLWEDHVHALAVAREDAMCVPENQR